MSLVCLIVSVVRGVLLVFAKVFGLQSLGFILDASSSPQGGFLFPFEGFFSFFPFFFFFVGFMGPKLTPSYTPLFFFCL